ncbi:MAG: rod shape-determining protein, partial [Clostridia bacterium]|nr:rod shape-determining protein [Clostridia bacterium]
MADKEKKDSALSSDKELGIDLGTANTVIFQKNKGIILREPSIIAVDVRTDEILAAGKDAKDMAGRTPEHIMILNPMSAGAVADLPACTAMLKYFLHKTLKGLSLRKPKAMISVPSTLTDVERRAVEDAAKQAGIMSVSLFEAPMAAALGAELPIGSSKGSFIMNIGAGITETAVLSLGDIVASAGARIGSN